MRLKCLLVLCSLAASLFTVGTAVGQKPIFPVQPDLPIYQPANGCASCVYVLSQAVSGDFNGDGRLDLAYIESPTQGPSAAISNNFVVIAFGQLTAAPVQMATELQACTPVTIAAADLNNDHKLDLAVVCQQGYLDLLLGNGDGTFLSPAHASLPSFTVSSMTFADFNGDGLPDASYLGFASGVASYAVAINSGKGQFAAAKTYPLSLTSPTGIAAGDFNGDGKQDLVFGPGFVLGNGDGTFGTAQSLPGVTGNFTVGDFNHDGFSDLAYSINSSTASPLYLLPGSSSGLSGQPTTLSTPEFPNAVLLALDLTGSGNLDLIAYPPADDGISILLGDGKGGFSNPISFETSQLLAFADLNADGKPDLIGADPTQQGLSLPIYYGNANGTLQAAPLNLVNGSSLTLADMNGDGLPDAVVSAGVPLIYLSNGNGQFTPVPSPLQNISATFAATADFNGDNHTDVASISPGTTCIGAECAGGGPQPAQISILLGNGDGTLTLKSTVNLQQEVVTAVLATDFNRDNKTDLLVTYANASTGGALYLAGNGDGTFAAPVPVPLLGQSPSRLALADLNSDGKPDFVVADTSGTIVAYLNNGDGTFTPTSQILQFLALDLLVEDVTGDGIPDLITSNSQAISVFHGNGDGTFTANPIFSSALPASTTIAGTPWIQVGDLNGDGMPEIGVTYFAPQGRLVVFLNQGSGSFQEDPSNYFAGSASYPSQQFLAFGQLNENAIASGKDQYLDALVLTTAGLTSLLNQNNPDPPVVPTLTLSPANGQLTVTAGQTVTINAVLSTLGATAPSGTVTFFANQLQIGSAPVSQSQASLGIPIQASGVITVQAVYNGDANYGSATAFLDLTSTATSTTTTLTSTSATVTQGASVTFTATVVPASATGSVTFSDGNAVLGTGTLALGAATYSTASLTTGSHSITAAYAGDTNDVPSTSPALSLTVTAPTFQLATNPTTLTIAQGSSGTTQIAVTPNGNYSGTLSFACSGLPANSTCTFSPASLTFSGAIGESQQTVTMTIATNVSTQALLRNPTSTPKTGNSHQLFAAALFGFPGIVLIALGRRKLLRHGSLFILTLLLFLGAASSLPGCGSSGSHAPSGPVTPIGTSTVAVSASGGATPLNLTLNITQ